MAKLLKSKQTSEMAEMFMELVEETIFAKGWDTYTDWENVQDII